MSIFFKATLLSSMAMLSTETSPVATTHGSHSSNVSDPTIEQCVGNPGLFKLSASSEGSDVQALPIVLEDQQLENPHIDLVVSGVCNRFIKTGLYPIILQNGAYLSGSNYDPYNLHVVENNRTKSHESSASYDPLRTVNADKIPGTSNIQGFATGSMTKIANISLPNGATWGIWSNRLGSALVSYRCSEPLDSPPKCLFGELKLWSRFPIKGATFIPSPDSRASGKLHLWIEESSSRSISVSFGIVQL